MNQIECAIKMRNCGYEIFKNKKTNNLAAILLSTCNNVRYQNLTDGSVDSDGYDFFHREWVAMPIEKLRAEPNISISEGVKG